MSNQLVNVQPMGVFLPDGTYFVKPGDEDTWETCNQKEICDPNYEPYFAIYETDRGKDGHAIYNKDLKPIVCTNRNIFKNSDIERDFIDGIINTTSEVWVFKGEHSPFRKRESIFFLNFKMTELIERESDE